MERWLGADEGAEAEEVGGEEEEDDEEEEEDEEPDMDCIITT